MGINQHSVEVATCLIFDKDKKLLIYLRDDNPSISFPNCWDLFGGFVEADETPESALVREIREELGITVTDFHKFADYSSAVGARGRNTKRVYWARISQSWTALTLYEGQRLLGIDLNDRCNFRFANILSVVVDDFANAKIEV